MNEQVEKIKENLNTNFFNERAFSEARRFELIGQFSGQWPEIWVTDCDTESKSLYFTSEILNLKFSY